MQSSAARTDLTAAESTIGATQSSSTDEPIQKSYSGPSSSSSDAKKSYSGSLSSSTAISSQSQREIPTNHSTAVPHSKAVNRIKGNHAQFLRENPRFLNDPISCILPNEGGRSVRESMDWVTPEDQGKRDPNSSTLQQEDT